MGRAPAILAVIVGGILALGLLQVLEENLKVAPWADSGGRGRLHHQLKNATRIGGSVEDVRRSVARAATLQDEPAAPAAATWRGQVQAAAGWDPRPRHVVVLAGDGPDAVAWALPGAYWAAFSGCPVVVLPGVDVAPAVRELERLGLPAYLLAPPALVSEETARQLEAVAPVRRIAADDLAEHAVRVASFRDEGTGFGWGRTHPKLATWYHFAMVAPAEAAWAWAALPLARATAAPILFADDRGGVPAATERYWWSLRSDWFTTPSETSFRHLWVLGNRVTYAAQARMDVAVEKAPYLSKGSIGLGPLEGLGLVFIALGLAGFVFVLLHGTRQLPDVMAANRIAWAFTALLVPVLGVVLYVAAYRRPQLERGGHMVHWLRPPAVQAAAATAMGFGYGAPLMIAVGYLFAYYGFPLAFGQWADGWWFVLGAGMPVMMIAMYVGAVLLAWPLVQTGMQAMMHQAPPAAVRWRALGVTALSMAAVSLGMMTMSWWMMMERAPMMMPHEDEILWFVSLWLASAVGFLVAWPLNWPMVRRHLKPGST